MIYRSEFYANQILDSGIEHDHRHISRVISLCWKSLGEDKQKLWYAKAAEEKRQHQLLHPDYRFRPKYRKQPIQRRNVKRNGPKDMKRCEALAQLITEGKKGNELKAAIDAFDAILETQVDEQGEDTYKDCKMAALQPDKGAATSPTLAVSGTILHCPLLPPYQLYTSARQLLDLPPFGQKDIDYRSKEIGVGERPDLKAVYQVCPEWCMVLR